MSFEGLITKRCHILDSVLHASLQIYNWNVNMLSLFSPAALGTRMEDLFLHSSHPLLPPAVRTYAVLQFSTSQMLSE